MEATLLLVQANARSADQTHKNLSAIKPGWNFIKANSYAQAKSVVRQNPPDAALVEDDLNGLSGFELLNELVLMNPHMKLFLTGPAISDQYRSGVRQDGLGYVFLEKPYSLGGLVKKIEQAVAPERAACALCTRPATTAIALYAPNPYIRPVVEEELVVLEEERVSERAA